MDENVFFDVEAALVVRLPQSSHRQILSTKLGCENCVLRRGDCFRSDGQHTPAPLQMAQTLDAQTQWLELNLDWRTMNPSTLALCLMFCRRTNDVMKYALQSNGLRQAYEG